MSTAPWSSLFKATVTRFRTAGSARCAALPFAATLRVRLNAGFIPKVIKEAVQPTLFPEVLNPLPVIGHILLLGEFGRKAQIGSGGLCAGQRIVCR